MCGIKLLAFDRRVFGIEKFGLKSGVLGPELFNKMKTVPSSLRIWFVVHGIVDLVFGLPLLFFPAVVLSLFSFPSESLLTARLVGAALLGIGGISLWARNEPSETYLTLLRMKLMWSGSAIVGIALSLAEGVSFGGWFILGLFLLFFVVWGYYWNILRKK